MNKSLINILTFNGIPSFQFYKPSHAQKLARRKMGVNGNLFIILHHPYEGNTHLKHPQTKCGIALTNILLVTATTSFNFFPLDFF